MPRTKKGGKNQSAGSKLYRELKMELELQRDYAIEELDKMYDNLILEVKLRTNRELNLCKDKTKTLRELGEEAAAVAKLQKNEVDFNVDKTVVIKRSNKTFKRSYSFNDDGYLTTESCSMEIPEDNQRTSRNRTRTAKKARLSRSHSKSANNRKLLTPMNNVLATNHFTVTPKINPKTPQAILRRPKVGETAISLQGSPLMVGNVVSDTLANINIPLDDGSLMSIQPRGELRKSQVPSLNPEVQNQLKALRANLNLLLD